VINFIAYPPFILEQLISWCCLIRQLEYDRNKRLRRAAGLADEFDLLPVPVAVLGLGQMLLA